MTARDPPIPAPVTYLILFMTEPHPINFGEPTFPGLGDQAFFLLLLATLTLKVRELICDGFSVVKVVRCMWVVVILVVHRVV